MSEGEADAIGRGAVGGPGWQAEAGVGEHGELALAGDGYAGPAALAVGSHHTEVETLSQGADQLTEQRGIDTIVVTGTATNTCCEATARDGMMLNFRTVVVSDANAARSDAEHSASLSNLLNMFADVRTTDEMIALLAARKDALVG